MKIFIDSMFSKCMTFWHFDNEVVVMWDVDMFMKLYFILCQESDAENFSLKGFLVYTTRRFNKKFY